MFDAIIIGLGGMGSATAYRIALRGRSVLGLERFNPAHDRGSSHGESRIIRKAYHENPSYVPLVLRAYELWRELERESGSRILHECGGLMIGPQGSSVVKGATLSAQQHSLPYELLSAQELHRRFPVLNPDSGYFGLYEPGAGFLRPEVAIEANIKLAKQLGAELHFNEIATRWSVDADDFVTVETLQGNYRARRLIVTAGPWASSLLVDLNLPLRVLRHVMCWFQPRSEVTAFAPDRFPIYIWDTGSGSCFYGFPFGGVTQAAVKVAMHSGGQDCVPDMLDRGRSDVDVDEVRACLERFIPSLNGDLIRTSACMYTMTPDEHFIVGIHPHYSQVCVACGFSGHGFKFASVVGEIMADLALDGRTRHRIDFLSPSRFS